MHRPVAVAIVQLQSAAKLQVTHQIQDVISASLNTTRGELFKDTRTAPKQFYVLLDGSGVVMKLQVQTSMQGDDSFKAQVTTGWNAVFCGLTGLNPSKYI